MKARSQSLLAYNVLLACALLSLLLFIPVYAQGPEPAEFSTAKAGAKTIIALSANCTTLASDAELTLESSEPVKKAVSSDWWNATAEGNKVSFRMVGKADKPSMFYIQSNSTDADYMYELLLNGTKYTGKIKAASSADSRFSKWSDPKENAATAFLPEGWSADLQIIRPYKSMTGFIFFARGSENSLIYVFQPFMPLHLGPNNSFCKSMQLCSGSITTEKVREMSLGYAPMTISEAKTPEQYFSSEVLPVLKKNLSFYDLKSEQRIYALAYGSNSTQLLPAHDVQYTFETEGKKIHGRAMIFTRNYDFDNKSIWNGFIVGVESSEKNFDSAMQKAAVALLTFRFNEKWLDAEQKVLLNNANESKELDVIPLLMANNTIGDFRVIVPTAAHKMVRTYNDTMIAGYLDNDTKKELDLPLFPNFHQWYLDGDQLLGRKAGRNTMNSNSLEPLF